MLLIYFNLLLINGGFFMTHRGEERTNGIRCRFNPHSCHSARRACSELQNPLPHFAKENLLPGEKVPARADEGCEKVLFPGPQPTYATVPLSRRAKVNLGMWILRLRLLLSAE